jgi:hypothetical protein
MTLQRTYVRAMDRRARVEWIADRTVSWRPLSPAGKAAQGFKARGPCASETSGLCGQMVDDHWIEASD